jgi:MFS family permease
MKRAKRIKHYFLREINSVIRLLIASDVVLTGAAGLLAPVFALFIEDFIKGGNAAVAGVAAAIYLFTKSALQIPIATFIDKIRGERDDFNLLFWGSIAMSLIPLLYLVVSLPWHLYVVQFILGIFTAFTFPSYMSIFTHHIDSHKEGTEWGVYFTLTDIASAALAAVGGYIAVTVGFPFLIASMVVLSLIGTILIWPIRPYLRKK